MIALALNSAGKTILQLYQAVHPGKYKQTVSKTRTYKDTHTHCEALKDRSLYMTVPWIKVPTSAGSTYTSAKPTGPPTCGLSHHQISHLVYMAELTQQKGYHLGQGYLCITISNIMYYRKEILRTTTAYTILPVIVYPITWTQEKIMWMMRRIPK